MTADDERARFLAYYRDELDRAAAYASRLYYGERYWALRADLSRTWDRLTDWEQMVYGNVLVALRREGYGA